MLVRNGWMIDTIEKQCELSGWMYSSRSRQKENQAIINAIYDWEALRRGESISVLRCKNVLEKYGIGKQDINI